MPIRLSPKMADWRSRLSRQILVEKHSQNFKHGRFGAIAATFGVHRHFSPYSAVQAVSWGRDDGLGSNRIGMKLSIQRNSGNYASMVRNVSPNSLNPLIPSLTGIHRKDHRRHNDVEESAERDVGDKGPGQGRMNIPHKAIHLHQSPGRRKEEADPVTD